MVVINIIKERKMMNIIKNNSKSSKKEKSNILKMIKEFKERLFIGHFYIPMPNDEHNSKNKGFLNKIRSIFLKIKKEFSSSSLILKSFLTATSINICFLPLILKSSVFASLLSLILFVFGMFSFFINIHKNNKRERKRETIKWVKENIVNDCLKNFIVLSNGVSSEKNFAKGCSYIIEDDEIKDWEWDCCWETEDYEDWDHLIDLEEDEELEIAYSEAHNYLKKFIVDLNSTDEKECFLLSKNEFIYYYGFIAKTMGKEWIEEKINKIREENLENNNIKNKSPNHIIILLYIFKLMEIDVENGLFKSKEKLIKKKMDRLKKIDEKMLGIEKKEKLINIKKDKKTKSSLNNDVFLNEAEEAEESCDDCLEDEFLRLMDYY